MQTTRPDSVRRAVARIRQLFCLGLGGEAVMPGILRELHGLAPSNANAFLRAGPSGEITNSHLERSAHPRIAPLYFTQFYERRDRETIKARPESLHDFSTLYDKSDVILAKA